MQQILLDTNFILSCIRNKLDLFEELKFRGYAIIIPEQIINEIEKIKISVKKLRFRKEAELALRILKKHKLDIPVIAISKGEGLRSAIAPDKLFFAGEKMPLELPLA